MMDQCIQEIGKMGKFTVKEHSNGSMVQSIREIICLERSMGQESSSFPQGIIMRGFGLMGYKMEKEFYMINMIKN